MDVSAYLKRESTGGKTVRQIIFEGERFDAVSVQRWRERLLDKASRVVHERADVMSNQDST